MKRCLILVVILNIMLGIPVSNAAESLWDVSKNARAGFKLPLSERSWPTTNLNIMMTIATRQMISAPRIWPALLSAQDGSGEYSLNPIYHYSGGSGPVRAGNSYPDNLYIKLQGANYGYRVTNNETLVPIELFGDEVEFAVKAAGEDVTVLVNGKYTSLKGAVVPMSGEEAYVDVRLPKIDKYSIELIGGQGLEFYGVYTKESGNIVSYNYRNDRTLVICDSFGEPTIPGGSQLAWLGYGQVMQKALDIDDLRLDCVGGTGLTAAIRPKLTYVQRAATDIGMANSDGNLKRIIIQNSINDGLANTPTLIHAFDEEVVIARRSAPEAEIYATSIMMNNGAGSIPPRIWINNGALKSEASVRGVVWLDIADPTPARGGCGGMTTLASSALSGASTIRTTSKLCLGATYSFADGSRFFVRAAPEHDGSFVSTIDRLYNTENVGSPITRVGTGLWTGTGHVGAISGWGRDDFIVSSDGTHPTNLGDVMIGLALANRMQKIKGAPASRTSSGQLNGLPHVDRRAG